MKKIIFTIIITLAIFSFAKSQTLADFENVTAYSISPYGYATTPVVEANPHQVAPNTSANALHVIKDAGTFAGGTKILFNAPIAIPVGALQISFQVWTNATLGNVYFKYGNIVNGSETEIAGGWAGDLTPNTWNTLKVNIKPGTTTIDYFYIHPGRWDANNDAPQANGDYFFDNFKFYVPQSSDYLVDCENTTNYDLSSWSYASPASYVSNPHSTGNNTSENVIHIAKDKAGTFDEGVKILFKSPVPVPQGATKIMMQVYTTNTSGSIYFKYCLGSDVTSLGEGWLGNPTPNNWTTLSVDIVSGTTSLDRFFLFAGTNDNAPAAIGEYYVDNIGFDVPTSLSKPEIESNQITFYPNPVKDMIVFSKSDMLTINIYDVVGKLVFTSVTNAKTINLSTLNSGIYFMNIIYSDNRTNTTKLIKE